MGSILEHQGQLAVVLGSDTPVGDAVVRRLHEAGLKVFTIDREGTLEHPLADSTYHGELREEATWDEVADHIKAGVQWPSMLVHALNVHEASGTPFDLPPAEWDRVHGHNVRTAFLAGKTLIPLMEWDSAVVLVGSVLAGWDSRPDLAYGSSQAALLGLTRSLALAGARSRIRVNAVCAGLVNDPRAENGGFSPDIVGRIPMGRAADAVDVADPVLFLLSSDARHISGTSLVVDGGQSLQSWSNTPHEVGHFPPAPPVPEPQPIDRVRRFEGKTVLITGAPGGMGTAAVRRFASEGANVVLLDRDREGAERLAHELSQQGIGTLALEVDVTDERAMERAFAKAEQHFGQLDVVFNNAGIGSSDMSILDIPIEHWDEVQAINFRGVFLGSRFGAKALRRAGGGTIVNMGSSTARHDTITGGAAYMASKAAIEAMTKSLAIQVAQYGIRANTIAPGVVETKLSFRQAATVDPQRFEKFAARIPLGRVGQPEDVAATVAFLASGQARHITGATLLIDGGQTMTRWVSAPDLGRELP